MKLLLIILSLNIFLYSKEMKNDFIIETKVEKHNNEEKWGIQKKYSKLLLGQNLNFNYFSYYYGTDLSLITEEKCDKEKWGVLNESKIDYLLMAKIGIKINFTNNEVLDFQLNHNLENSNDSKIENNTFKCNYNYKF